MMKRKHWATVALLLAIIPLGIMGFDAFRMFENPGYTRAFANPSIRPMEVPGPGVVREIAQLSGEIKALQTGPAPDRTRVDLKLFGYEPSEHINDPQELRGSAGKENPGYIHMDYTVSLTFASKTKGFCVVDGNFYPEGGTLPDGAKILKVEAQRVWIEKYNLKRWISVAERVGVTLSQKR